MVKNGSAFCVSLNYRCDLCKDLQKNITFFPSSNSRFISRVIVFAKLSTHDSFMIIFEVHTTSVHEILDTVRKEDVIEDVTGRRSGV